MSGRDSESKQSREDPLIDLMSRCCLRIEGEMTGTGFFVGPGLVLTCAHVVGPHLKAGRSDVLTWWKDDRDNNVSLLDIASDEDEDIALLRVKYKKHPCVCIENGQKVKDELYAWGFPRRGDEHILDGISGEFVSTSELTLGRQLLKFKSANVISGYSGGPLLNRQTGRIIGVVMETLGEYSDLGGWAIPAEFILERFSEHLVDPGGKPKAYQEEWIHVAITVHKTTTSSDANVLAGESKDNLKTVSAARSNRFVGRAEHIKSLREKLRNKAKLITILGPGGSGKTRLSIEVADPLKEDYRDGIWMVELAGIKERDLVPGEIARVLSIELPKQASATDGLLDKLSSRKILLILDNCEHLLPPQEAEESNGEPFDSNQDDLDAFIELVYEIIRNCPEATILATSRVALRLQEEQIHELPPMPVPSESESDRPDLLQRFEAVELLQVRANEKGSSFQVNESNAKDVVEICRRLAGLPLAIEIAAAKLRNDTAKQLALDLDRALSWKGVSHFTDLRHKTMQAVVGWSYHLLSDRLKTVFRSLAVFTGGFFRDAATALHEEEVQGELSELHDSSLVQQAEVDGRFRYNMLEPLHQFATALLNEDELEKYARRHVRWFQNLAKAAEPELLGAEQDVWLRRIEFDYANFMRAIAHAMQHDLDAALDLGAYFWRFWDIRSFLQEGYQRLNLLLERVGDDHLNGNFGRCLSGAGLLAHRQGLSKEAQHFFERALSYERNHGVDKVRLVQTMNDMGIAYNILGRNEEATKVYRQAVEVAEDIGDDREAGTIYFNLGKLELENDKFHEAEQDLNEAKRLFKACQNNRELAFPLCWLGILHAIKQPPELDRAEEFLSESLQLRKKANDARGIAYCLSGLGHIATLNDNIDKATEYAQEALKLHAELANRKGIAESFEWWALMLEKQRHLELAVQVSFGAAAIRKQSQIPRPLVLERLQSEILDRCLQTLSEEKFKKAQSDGTQVHTDELISRLLA